MQTMAKTGMMGERRGGSHRAYDSHRSRGVGFRHDSALGEGQDGMMYARHLQEEKDEEADESKDGEDDAERNRDGDRTRIRAW